MPRSVEAGDEAVLFGGGKIELEDTIVMLVKFSKTTWVFS
jgi:hypothetical protein